MDDAAHTPTDDRPDARSDGLPDGLVAFVKHNCPTCALVEPVLAQLANAGDLSEHCAIMGYQFRQGLWGTFLMQ